MLETPPRFRRAQAVVAIAVAVLATIGGGGTASAHTDFDSSVPADGAVVTGPVTDVVVNFTNPATPAGEGFELLDPSGTVRAPASVDETDGTSFVVRFDPALGAGVYGFRWQVRAGDAHPIDGSFSFEITTPTTTTVAAAVDNSTATTPGTATSTIASGALDSESTPESVVTGEASPALDEFLSSESSLEGASKLGHAGRIVTMFGTIFGVGMIAALVWTIRGSRDEIGAQLGWIRLAGIVMVVGGLVELAALSEVDAAAGVSDLLTTKAGVATALKMVGGLAIFLGFHRGAGQVVTPLRPLSAAVGADLAAGVGAEASGRSSPDECRWAPTPAASVGLGGLALVLASFWFDGHTVSEGPWVLHAGINFVHVGAAAVWAGGVFAMTTVAWMRRRRSEPAGLAAMVVRFSTVAAISLTALVAAGVVMTWMIADSPSDLVDTPWGRLLLAKTAVVAFAAAIGGYNHTRLRPALVESPDDPQLTRRLRVSLLAESALFVGVLVLTALLVAAAT